MWPPSTKLKMLFAIAILPLLFNTKQTWAQEPATTEPVSTTSDMPPTTSEMTPTNQTEIDTGKTSTTMQTKIMPTNATGEPAKKDEGMPIGIIIGIAAGGVVLLLVIVGVVVWCLCCRNKDSEEDAEGGADTEKESAKEGAESQPIAAE